MTITKNRSRQPAGVPVGGEYAKEAGASTGLALTPAALTVDGALTPIQAQAANQLAEVGLRGVLRPVRHNPSPMSRSDERVTVELSDRDQLNITVTPWQGRLHMSWELASGSTLTYGGITPGVGTGNLRRRLETTLTTAALKQSVAEVTDSVVRDVQGELRPDGSARVRLARITPGSGTESAVTLTRLSDGSTTVSGTATEMSSASSRSDATDEQSLATLRRVTGNASADPVETLDAIVREAWDQPVLRALAD